MSTALIVFLNVFFIAFVLVAVVGTLAWGVMSDRSTTTSTARLRSRLERQRTPRPRPAPARRQGRQALDLGA